MKHRFFILILLLGWSTLLYGQKTITGTITDSKSGQPVSSVNLSADRGKINTASNPDGHFTLPAGRLPVTIRFTHIAYESKTLTINKFPDLPLEITLDPKVKSIREVVIEGGKYNQILKRENFYVIDFEFDQDKIWVVGYADNSILKPQLILLDLNGYIIQKVPANGRTDLFKDAIGRIHLMDKESMVKLDFRDGEIKTDEPRLFSGWEQNLFDLQMVLGKTGIFKWAYNNGMYYEYAALDFSDTAAIPLIIHQVYDRKQFASKELAKKYHHGYIPTIQMGSFGMGGNRSGGSGDSRNNASWDPSDQFTAMSQDQFFKFKPVTTHLFRFRNNFLIFEDKDCLLWKYDISFINPEELKLNPPKNYKNADMVQDPVTGSLYLTYTLNGYGYLTNINPLTGAIQYTRKVENFYRIEDIKVYNNRLWFKHQGASNNTMMNLYSTPVTGN